MAKSRKARKSKAARMASKKNRANATSSSGGEANGGASTSSNVSIEEWTQLSIEYGAQSSPAVSYASTASASSSDWVVVPIPATTGDSATVPGPDHNSPTHVGDHVSEVDSETLDTSDNTNMPEQNLETLSETSETTLKQLAGILLSFAEDKPKESASDLESDTHSTMEANMPAQEQSTMQAELEWKQEREIQDAKSDFITKKQQEQQQEIDRLSKENDNLKDYILDYDEAKKANKALPRGPNINLDANKGTKKQDDTITALTYTVAKVQQEFNDLKKLAEGKGLNLSEVKTDDSPFDVALVRQPTSFQPPCRVTTHYDTAPNVLQVRIFPESEKITIKDATIDDLRAELVQSNESRETMKAEGQRQKRVNEFLNDKSTELYTTIAKSVTYMNDCDEKREIVRSYTASVAELNENFSKDFTAKQNHNPVPEPERTPEEIRARSQALEKQSAELQKALKAMGRPEILTADDAIVVVAVEAAVEAKDKENAVLKTRVVELEDLYEKAKAAAVQTDDTLKHDDIPGIRDQITSLGDELDKLKITGDANIKFISDKEKEILILREQVASFTTEGRKLENMEACVARDAEIGRLRDKISEFKQTKSALLEEQAKMRVAIDANKATFHTNQQALQAKDQEILKLKGDFIEESRQLRIANTGFIPMRSLAAYWENQAKKKDKIITELQAKMEETKKDKNLEIDSKANDETIAKLQGQIAELEKTKTEKVNELVSMVDILQEDLSLQKIKTEKVNELSSKVDVLKQDLSLAKSQLEVKDQQIAEAAEEVRIAQTQNLRFQVEPYMEEIAKFRDGTILAQHRGNEWKAYAKKKDQVLKLAQAELGDLKKKQPLGLGIFGLQSAIPPSPYGGSVAADKQPEKTATVEFMNNQSGETVPWTDPDYAAPSIQRTVSASDIPKASNDTAVPSMASTSGAAVLPFTTSTSGNTVVPPTASTSGTAVDGPSQGQTTTDSTPAAPDGESAAPASGHNTFKKNWKGKGKKNKSLTTLFNTGASASTSSNPSPTDTTTTGGIETPPDSGAPSPALPQQDSNTNAGWSAVGKGKGAANHKNGGGNGHGNGNGSGNGNGHGNGHGKKHHKGKRNGHGNGNDNGNGAAGSSNAPRQTGAGANSSAAEGGKKDNGKGKQVGKK